MIRHAPKPWTVNGRIVSDAFGTPVAWVSVKNDLEGSHAALLAAAPDLVAALRETLRALEAHTREDAKRNGLSVSQVCPCHGQEISRAHAALDRAEGR